MNMGTESDLGIYQTCIDHAVKTGCQKLGFGAVLVDTWPDGRKQILTSAYNKPLKALAQVCDPRCVRFDIPSRTESMLGACIHAEEIVLNYARSMDWPLRQCAIQMYVANLKTINVWYEEAWQRIGLADAVQQAYEYATGAMEADSK